MNKGFLKFKRKIRASAIIRALLTGVSLGAITVAVPWLLAKLTGSEPELLMYGLIGGGVALVSFLVFLLILLPSDKRLAKRLDEKLQLHEKVQTMIAFRGDDSQMAVMQREDTDQLLQQLPKKKYRNHAVWFSAILPVLACACLAVTILIPVQAAAQPPKAPETGWRYGVYQQQRVQTLIDFVRNSNMQEAPRAEIVAQLEAMHSQLLVTSTKKAMQECVVNVMDEIHDIAKVCDTYSTIIRAMATSPNTTVSTMGKTVGSLKSKNVTTYFNETLFNEMVSRTEADAEGGEAEIAPQADAPMNAVSMSAMMAQAIEQALGASGEDESNALYKAYADFAAALKTVTEATDELTIKQMLQEAEVNMQAAIKQPAIDSYVEQETISTLMDIFDIPSDLLPEDIKNDFENSYNDSTSDPEEDEEETSTGGGYGEGDWRFGSNDSIYDHLNKVQNQVYGAVILEDYYPILLGYLMEENMDPDLKVMIEAYISALLNSGFKIEGSN